MRPTITRPDRSGTRRRIPVIVTLTLSLMLLGVPAQASHTYHFSYDGCDWYIKLDRVNPWWSTHDSSEARVQDKNGGCRYLTAWVRSPDGSSLKRAGPTSNEYVIAYDDDGGEKQGRGKITTWEHDWWQYSPWYTIYES